MEFLFLILGWLWIGALGAAIGQSRGQTWRGLLFALGWGPLGLLGAMALPMSRAAMAAEERLRAEARDAADLARRADRARQGR